MTECDTEIQKEKPRRKTAQLSYECPDPESNGDRLLTIFELQTYYVEHMHTVCYQVGIV
jgi:hypothetical protein